MPRLNRAKYHKGDGIVEIIIRDSSGRKEDVLRFNKEDKKTQKLIGRLLYEKYNINLTPIVESKKDFFEF